MESSEKNSEVRIWEMTVIGRIENPLVQEEQQYPKRFGQNQEKPPTKKRRTVEFQGDIEKKISNHKQ